MASLKSVDGVQGLDYYEYRDREFFNKFKYRARVRFHGLALTYYASNTIQFLDRLDKSNSRWRKINKDEVKNNLPTIEKYIAFKNEVKKDKDFVIRVEGDTAAIFSNDFAKLQELRNIQDLDIDVTEAVTSAYSGIKYFVREPKHKYRVYFRSTAVDQSFINELKELFTKNKNIYPSKALTAWLYKTRHSSYYSRFLSSSFSIDYNDESTSTYLSLMLGDKLGHRYKLEKHPEPI